MKKGEKPSFEQTRTVRTLHKLTSRIKHLKENIGARPMFMDEEKVELATLVWIQSMLRADKEEDFTPMPDYHGVRGPN